MLLGAVLVFFLFPRRDAEQQLLERYAAEDAPSGGGAVVTVDEDPVDHVHA